MILCCTLHQGNANLVNIGKYLIIVNKVIEYPVSILVTSPATLTAIIRVDRAVLVHCASLIIAELRTELNAVSQAFERLPHLAEVNISIENARNIESLALIYVQIKFVDWVDNIYIAIGRKTDIIAILVERYSPRQHSTKCVVVITSTGY